MERQEIYKLMLEKLETGKARTFCLALALSTPTNKKIKKLPELMVFKQDELIRRYYWFEPEDTKTRIDILKSLIEPT